jgi:ABC-type multidrug transport system ATPase subunit
MNKVVIDNISKSYGKVRAVEDFSLEVSDGEIFALVGPDGAGKTTLMAMLCDLTNPDKGSATISGHDVYKEFRKIKPLLGYMPQVFSLYPDLSVEENMIFYAGIYGVTGKEYRERRDRMYGFSNLSPFAGRRAEALSGGMKQKLALSCALMHDPELLILDEPTTGVDPLSRQQFWEILLDLRKQGVTIIVATPYMDEVARADRACFVYGGKKLAEGTPEELAKTFRGRVFRLDREPTRELIERLNHLPDITARRFGSSIHLYTDESADGSTVASALHKVNIDADNLPVIAPSLEDAFIQRMEQV